VRGVVQRKTSFSPDRSNGVLCFVPSRRRADDEEQSWTNWHRDVTTTTKTQLSLSALCNVETYNCALK